MSVETATYIDTLNASLPASGDPKSEGDNHIRLLKATVKATWPNVSGAVTPTHTELNFVDGVTSAIQTQLDGKATTAQGAKADTAVQSVNGVSGTAVVLVKGDIGLGNVDNTSDANKPVSTATQAALDLKANVASPAFTGTPTVPTASFGTNTTQAASTAFVQAAAFSAALPSQTGNAGKFVTTDGTTASWGVAGDVFGPAIAADNTLPRFDGTTGKLLQSSLATLDDTGGFAGVSSINGGQLAGLRNKIINGKMEIAQRGTSFAAIANGAFTVDRWKVITSSAGVCTVSQQADIPSGNEFQSSLRVAVTTADASVAAGDRFELLQVAEGFNVRDLIGRTFTLSFWVRSSKTGVHCVSFGNSGGDRSYIAEYTVNAANTWEQKSITVSSGLITAGTWDWMSGWGLGVRFTLMAGSSVQTTAGAWQTGNFTATSSQVNVLDTIGNIFAITGVQLEVGSVATPFEHRPYGMELALCQRYYEKSYDIETAPGAVTNAGITYLSFGPASSGVFGVAQFKQLKRATPTISTWDESGNSGRMSFWSTTFAVTHNLNALASNWTGQSRWGFSANTSTAGTAGTYSVQWTASAEL